MCQKTNRSGGKSILNNKAITVLQDTKTHRDNAARNKTGLANRIDVTVIKLLARFSTAWPTLDSQENTNVKLSILELMLRAALIFDRTIKPQIRLIHSSIFADISIINKFEVIKDLKYQNKHNFITIELLNLRLRGVFHFLHFRRYKIERDRAAKADLDSTFLLS